MAKKKEAEKKEVKKKAVKRAPRKKVIPKAEAPKEEVKVEAAVAEAKEETALAVQQEQLPAELAPPQVLEVPKLEPVEIVEQKIRCVSCGVSLKIGKGSVKFKCPNCAVLLGRCENCRLLGRTYKCACGFVGP